MMLSTISKQPDCICERPKTNFICIRCHRSFFGRVQKTCNKHPNVSAFQLFANENDPKKTLPFFPSVHNLVGIIGIFSFFSFLYRKFICLMLSHVHVVEDSSKKFKKSVQKMYAHFHQADSTTIQPISLIQYQNKCHGIGKNPSFCSFFN